MTLEFRRAVPADADRAVPLIYSSGPDICDWIVGGEQELALRLLRHCFVRRRGIVGCENHVVAVRGGEVVGIGAFYSGIEYKQKVLPTVFDFLSFLGLRRGVRALLRLMVVEKFTPPPDRQTLYIGHLGVPPELQSQGVCSALLRHQLEEARRVGKRAACLDVAPKNARAEKLYAKLGFVFTRQVPFTGKDPTGRLEAARRMVMPLDAA